MAGVAGTRTLGRGLWVEVFPEPEFQKGAPGRRREWSSVNLPDPGMLLMTEQLSLQAIWLFLLSFFISVMGPGPRVRHQLRQRSSRPATFTPFTLQKDTAFRFAKGRSNSLSHPNRMSHCWCSQLPRTESTTCLDPGMADAQSKNSRPGNDPSKSYTLRVLVKADRHT